MGIEDFAVDGGNEVFSRSRLRAYGFSDDEIGVARQRGALVRLHRGVYAVSQKEQERPRRPLELLRIVGVAARSTGMVVSHASAAVLHNIPLWGIDPGVVHLTRPGRGGSAQTPGRILHAAALGEGDVTEVRGFAVTSIARTLVDLARSSPFESAVIACDDVLRRRPALAGDLALAVEASVHRPGNRAARRAVAFADGRAESPGESRTRVLIHRLGLEPPELQIEVFDRDGACLGRSDLGYPDDASLIEFDGRVKYSALLRPGQNAHDVVIAEKRREDDIRGIGCTVLRIVWSELGQPEWLAGRLTELRRQGRAMRSAGVTTGSLRPRPPIRVQAPGQSSSAS